MNNVAKTGEQPDINRNLVNRLVKYLRVLRKLKTLGFVKVFSNNLADSVGVTAAVVRKDFSMVGVTGNKRGGYDIDALTDDVSKVLGAQGEKSVVLVGCGRIGSALMNYQEFAKESIHILAGFDAHPERVPSGPIPIHPMSELEAFVAHNKVDVGIIAVPESAATQVFDDMVKAGIRGFLNFTSVELKCHGRCDRPNCEHSCIISNVNIGLELENLFHLVTMETRPKASRSRRNDA